MSEDSKNKTYELPESFKRNHQFMPIIDHPISLRDQFAMSAMRGILSNEAMIAVVIEESAAWVSREAYLMADAMLSARGK
ncbi:MULTISPECIES: hypothetical protein [Providencia]|uniref:hypothetical protein n=1 Tax=Providencia TaxID=586 RepID=UPI0015EC5F4F|nr:MULTISPECIES: hypothetical protein [Providencia]QLQ62923.1 hypothetical protein H0904_11905 [Providencia rettgeri]URR22888.1 hypothetical protein L3Q80_00075 [Providencia rettgeri]